MNRSVALRAFLLLALSSPLAAHELPAQIRGPIERLIRSEMETLGIPGLTLAAAAGHELIYSGAFGMSDLENSVPVTTATVFRTASVAKPMTATGVMLLVEEGKIDLDAPVQGYCQAFPEKRWEVTTRMLLGHLGGIRHYQKRGEAVGTDHFFGVSEAIRLFAGDPLLHQPSTRYRYTTYGYNLLGCAIEGASGMSYERFMAERVFAPAGMERTRPDNHFLLVNDRARGYMRIDERDMASLPPAMKSKVKLGQILRARLHDTSMKVPGGGLLSTSEDLVRFALALMAGKLVSAESLERMWTSQKTVEGEETGYGFGFGVGEAEGLRYIAHSGSQAGVRTHLGILPERGIVVAVMCNLTGVNLRSIARGVSRELFELTSRE